MWLLDVNLPNGLTSLLSRLGFACESSIARGWRALTNGDLASAAIAAGFRVILTRDREFATSAERILVHLPDLAIVVVTIPQAREAAYVAAFEEHWRERPIVPRAGTVVEWPSSPGRP